jgi:hypothetical protein
MQRTGLNSQLLCLPIGILGKLLDLDDLGRVCLLCLTQTS